MGHPYNGNNSKEIKKIITLEYNEEINGTKKKRTSVQKLPRYFSPLSLLLSWRGLHTNVVVYHLQKKESKSTSSFSFPIICLLQNVIY